MSEELTVSGKQTIAVQNKRQAVERLRASLEDVVTIRSKWLDDKREELERAVEANKALSGVGASDLKKRYVKHRIQMLRKIIHILEAGFIPMPRFSGDKVQIDMEELPIKALVALNDATATELFDEIRLVRGNQGQGPRERRRVQRDPFLVGIVRMPAVRVPNPQYPTWEHGSLLLRAREEHFLLAWWRPEDEVDADLW